MSSKSFSAIRRRRPLGLDTPYIMRQFSEGSHSHQNGSSSPSSSSFVVAWTARVLLATVAFTLLAITRHTLVANPHLPLESLMPLVYLTGQTFIDGEDSLYPFRFRDGLIETIFFTIGSFFLYTPESANRIGFVLVMINTLQWLPLRLSLAAGIPLAHSLVTNLMGGMATQHGNQQAWFWTVASHCCVGFCTAMFLRTNHGFTTPRQWLTSSIVFVGKTIRNFYRKVPLLVAIGSLLFKIFVRPIVALAKLIGLKWLVAGYGWLALMYVEWNAQVSIGGLMIGASLALGFGSSVIEDHRRSNSTKNLRSQLVFIATVALANTLVYLITPPRSLPFIANAIISANVILYAAYYRSSPKGADKDKPVVEEVYTDFNTAVLMLLWVTLLVTDLANQIMNGWVVPSTGRMLLSVNTIGYGILMLISMFFDLVNRELHSKAMTKAQIQQQQLSNTLKNSAKETGGRKVVLSVDSNAINEQKGKDAKDSASASASGGSTPQETSGLPTSIAKPPKNPNKADRNDDGGEAAAPSTSTTPPGEHDRDTNTTEHDGSGSSDHHEDEDAADAHASAADDNAAADAGHAEVDHHDDEAADGVPKTTLVPAPVKQPRAVGEDERESNGHAPSEGSQSASGSFGAQSPSTKGGKKGKGTAADTEKERKEWQEAQLRSVLEEENEAQAKKKDRAKRAEERKRLEKEQKLAEQREREIAAQREKELKEQQELEKREKERKAQEERLRKQLEKERAEAARLAKEEAERQKREAEERKKKEKERKEKEKALAEEKKKKEKDGIPLPSPRSAEPAQAHEKPKKDPVKVKEKAPEKERPAQMDEKEVAATAPVVKKKPQFIASVDSDPVDTDGPAIIAPKPRSAEAASTMTPTSAAKRQVLPPQAICSVDDVLDLPSSTTVAPIPAPRSRQGNSLPTSPVKSSVRTPPAVDADLDERPFYAAPHPAGDSPDRRVETPQSRSHAVTPPAAPIAQPVKNTSPTNPGPLSGTERFQFLFAQLTANDTDSSLSGPFQPPAAPQPFEEDDDDDSPMLGGGNRRTSASAAFSTGSGSNIAPSRPSGLDFDDFDSQFYRDIENEVSNVLKEDFDAVGPRTVVLDPKPTNSPQAPGTPPQTRQSPEGFSVVGSSSTPPQTIPTVAPMMTSMGQLPPTTMINGHPAYMVQGPNGQQYYVLAQPFQQQQQQQMAFQMPTGVMQSPAQQQQQQPGYVLYPQQYFAQHPQQRPQQ